MKRTLTAAAVCGLVIGAGAANAGRVTITDFFGSPGFDLRSRNMSSTVFDQAEPQFTNTDIENIYLDIAGNNNFGVSADSLLNNTVNVFALNTSDGLALFAVFGGDQDGSISNVTMQVTFDASIDHSVRYNDAGGPSGEVPIGSGDEFIISSFAWGGFGIGNVDADGLAIGNLMAGDTGLVDFTRVDFGNNGDFMATFNFLTFANGTWDLAATRTVDTSSARGFDFVVIPTPMAATAGLFGLGLLGAARRRS